MKQKTLQKLERTIEMAGRAHSAFNKPGGDNYLIALAAAQIAREAALDAYLEIKRETDKAH